MATQSAAIVRASSQGNAISRVNPRDVERLRAVSAAANEYASANQFTLYRTTKSQQTTRRQLADLSLFASFLEQVARLPLTGADFYEEPHIWSAVSGGLVEAFKLWMLEQGYNVRSVNIRLSTMRTYAELAYKAQHLPENEYLRIKAVRGYSHKEARRIDEKRSVTRVGHKKESPTPIRRVAASKLKKLQGKRPVDYRDRLLMCLLLDHGLRCEEVAILKLAHVSLADGLLAFFRPKVGKDSVHKLSQDTQNALNDYYAQLHLPHTASSATPLLRASNKSGKLSTNGMTTRAINKRVGHIGRELGIDNLSPHDCRHAWATEAARHSNLDALMQAGGWTSYAMPLRYIENKRIDNEGVIIEY
ncbi:MAG: site-specific integrase [Caldilineaceae bacterium]|nr:site-specific integrase [Caldilineaceae bacterium]